MPSLPNGYFHFPFTKLSTYKVPPKYHHIVKGGIISICIKEAGGQINAKKNIKQSIPPNESNITFRSGEVIFNLYLRYPNVKPTGKKSKITNPMYSPKKAIVVRKKTKLKKNIVFKITLASQLIWSMHH